MTIFALLASEHRSLGCRALACIALLLGGCSGVNKLTYHGDAARSGWNAQERELTPATVSGSRFALLWESPMFEAAGSTPARVFATPLYVDAVELRSPAFARGRYAVAYAVSTTGYVYAVNAKARAGVAPGTILWQRKLTDKPCTRGSFGNLSTPVIDLKTQRLYLTYCDETELWVALALDLRSGATLAGWPLRLDAAAINAPGINHNGGNQFPKTLATIQRAALNLSPDGSRLYISFGGEPTSGWMLSIDTHNPRVASAFSATTATEEGVGGMWAAGGPAVDAQGNIYVATGSSMVNMLAGKGIAGVFPESVGNWGQSIIKLRDSAAFGLALAGTYTPFNYCQVGAHDVDLGSSSPVLIDLPDNQSRTPKLLALGGGKQGNAYLLDREFMPGSLSKRQACGEDSKLDKSLLAPDAQPQFGQMGPVNVFGPYSDQYGMGDQAKSRSTLAYFRSSGGEHYIFLTGSAKQNESSGVSVAPSLARLRIVTAPGVPAYLRIDQLQPNLVFQNPGSPVISSLGARQAIVWVLDTNKPRTASLYGADAPQPVLYAVDALTMQLLWRSPPGQLHTSGKYNEPTVANGLVLVGTDRIQAFGLRKP